jgi:hypothetical protein
MPHNGGRSQFNFSNIQSSGMFLTLNLMKTSQYWSFGGSGLSTFIPIENLDENGYLTEFPAAPVANVSTVFEHPPLGIRATDHYVIKWQGTGTLQVPHGHSVLSGTLSGTNGRCVINVTSISGAGMRLTATTLGDHLHDLVYVHEDDEAALDGGQIFGTKIMERLAEARCGVARFLGLQGGFDGANSSNVTQWVHRRPVDYITWQGTQYFPELFGGTTTNSGNDYSLAFGTFALEDKATVHLLFNADAPCQTSGSSGTTVTVSQASPGVVTFTTHGMTANNSVFFNVTGGSLPSPLAQGTQYYVKTVLTPDTFTVSDTRGGAAINTTTSGSGTFRCVAATTIDINGTGPKIMASPNSSYGGTTSPFFNFSTQWPLGNGRYGTLVYDATLGLYIKNGGDALLDGGIINGTPPEMCLELAIQAGMHPWFVTPPLAAEGDSDYMSELALMCKARQDDDASWIVPRFEPPNETWNFVSAFHGTFYARAVSAALWSVNDDFQNAYGKWCSVLGQMVSGIWSDDRTKYQVICGIHTASGTAQNGRLASTLYVSEDAGDPAYDWVTHIAPTSYFSAGITTNDELQMAYDYSVGDAEEQEEIAAEYVNTGYLNIAFGMEFILNLHADQKAWAKAYNPDIEMTYYEGGWSPDYGASTSTATITGITNAADGVVTLAVGTAVFPPVGSSVSFASVGGMTGINSQTSTVVSVNSESRTVTIARDTTGDGTYTSGGTVTYVDSGTLRTALRRVSKLSPVSGEVATAMLSRSYLLGEYPSNFVIAGSVEASAWTKFEDSVYSDPLAEWDAIVEFNTSSTPIRLSLTTTG